MAYDAGANVKQDRPVSRIENDVEQLKRFGERVDSINDRVIRHARALGYYEPTPATGQAPTPVITTLADALQALEYALERCSGSLNVFD